MITDTVNTDIQFSSVQSLSRVRLSATPWIAACQASLSITISRSLLRLTSIESVMPSSHLILCRPRLLLPPIPLSIRVFSNESTLLMRCVSALTSVLPMNIQDWSLEWTGWISLQSKGLSRLFSNTTGQKHQFFGTQLSSQSNSHPYMTTGKTIALTTGNNTALTSISASTRAHSLWFKMFFIPGTFETKHEPQLYLYFILRWTGWIYDKMPGTWIVVFPCYYL